MKRIFSKGLLLLVLVIAGLSVSDIARSASSYTKTIQLIAGKADTVELRGAVSDVLVANPAVADVGTLRANRLYIVGKSVGDTNVLAYDDRGNQLADIAIQVRADDKNLQATLHEFFPDEKITARTVKTNIVLSGSVSSPAVATQVRDLAAHFLADKTQLVDLMKVRGEQQVMLKVKVIEADRTALRELGFTTAFKTGDLSVTRGTGPYVKPVPLGGLITGDQPFAMGALAFGPKLDSLQTALQGLETQGLVNTLAEPTLTAINGETAGFLAGGEFPIPSSKDAQGNVVITLTPFGVSLNFTPTVLSKERIALHLSTEVSDRDTADSVTLNGLQIPGLSVRRAETTVELGSGSTLMIAGLLKSNTLHTLQGYPGAKDLPIIGQLFQSKSFERDESELVFIVTPYLVDSYAEPNAVAEKSPPATLTPPGLPAAKDEKPAPAPVKTGSAAPVSMPQIQWTTPEPSAQQAARAAAAARAPLQPVEQSPLQQAKRVETSNLSPINQSLLDNLGKVYGESRVDKVGTAGRFGYIVE